MTASPTQPGTAAATAVPDSSVPASAIAAGTAAGSTVSSATAVPMRPAPARAAHLTAAAGPPGRAPAWPGQRQTGVPVVSWGRLASVAGISAGVAAAGAGAVLAASHVAVGRTRTGPDPAAGEPFGQAGGQSVSVTADDGVVLHAEVSGPADAPVTVVFSHGYCLRTDTWHYQMRGLDPGIRQVVWDQRGHGRSGRGDPGHDTIDQLGSDLEAVLAATTAGDGPVVLVGHSMGGMTIMALADRRPDLFGTKIASVVLLSTASHNIDATNWLPPAMRLPFRYAGPALLRGASRGWRAALVERVWAAGGDIAFLAARMIAFGPGRVGPSVVDYLERVVRETPISVIADFYLALLEHDKLAALEVLGRVPVVVMTGTRDRLIPAEQSVRLAAAIPGARLITVAGAGHMVTLENPDLVNQEIADLVRKLR